MIFAQREASETAIWLNEAAEKSNAGTHILSRLAEARAVVMAALIPPPYHLLNRQEYTSDTRYADNFLVVAPGITNFHQFEPARLQLRRRVGSCWLIETRGHGLRSG